MHATRVALTVKDFNYYIGHAYASLSRLHINMTAAPPRNIRLTAPRRTEMRHMMHQFRGNPAPRGEAPSGYIVDISRDDEGEDGGERRSTRAIVNRGGGSGGGGGGGGGDGGAGNSEGASESGGQQGQQGGQRESTGESRTNRPRPFGSGGFPGIGQLFPGLGFSVSAR